MDVHNGEFPVEAAAPPPLKPPERRRPRRRQAPIPVPVQIPKLPELEASVVQHMRWLRQREAMARLRVERLEALIDAEAAEDLMLLLMGLDAPETDTDEDREYAEQLLTLLLM